MRKGWIWMMASTLAVAGCTNMQKTSSKGEEDEGNEVKVKFDDCPAPVKATLAKESNNATIDTVDKEMKNGKTIYEADAMVNGQNWEIKVADDGTLVTKKVDNEEGEQKKGDKEDDEKNERKEKADKD
jgi:hypothetical protein